MLFTSRDQYVLSVLPLAWHHACNEPAVSSTAKTLHTMLCVYLVRHGVPSVVLDTSFAGLDLVVAGTRHDLPWHGIIRESKNHTAVQSRQIRTGTLAASRSTNLAYASHLGCHLPRGSRECRDHHQSQAQSPRTACRGGNAPVCI